MADNRYFGNRSPYTTEKLRLNLVSWRGPLAEPDDQVGNILANNAKGTGFRGFTALEQLREFAEAKATIEAYSIAINKFSDAGRLAKQISSQLAPGQSVRLTMSDWSETRGFERIYVDASSSRSKPYWTENSASLDVSAASADICYVVTPAEVSRVTVDRPSGLAVVMINRETADSASQVHPRDVPTPAATTEKSQAAKIPPNEAAIQARKAAAAREREAAAAKQQDEDRNKNVNRAAIPVIKP